MATDLIFFGLLAMMSGIAPKVISIREDYRAMRWWVRGGFMVLALAGVAMAGFGLYGVSES